MAELLNWPVAGELGNDRGEKPIKHARRRRPAKARAAETEPGQGAETDEETKTDEEAAESAALPASRAPLFLVIAGTIVLTVALGGWIWRDIWTTHAQHLVTQTTITTSGSRRQTVVDRRQTGTTALSGTTVISIVVAGAILLLGGVFSDQLESMSFLGAQLQLREVQRAAVARRTLREVIRVVPRTASADEVADIVQDAYLRLDPGIPGERRGRPFGRPRTVDWHPSPEQIQKAVAEAIAASNED